MMPRIRSSTSVAPFSKSREPIALLPFYLVSSISLSAVMSANPSWIENLPALGHWTCRNGVSSKTQESSWLP